MLSGPPVTAADTVVTAEQLLERFVAATGRQRRVLLPQLEQQREALLPLIPDQLDQLDPTGDDWVAGTLIQLMLNQGDTPTGQAWQERHPEGWLATSSAVGVAYTALQAALAAQEFEEADRITSALLRRLAGSAAESRGYVYFSEVPPMSGADLDTLDRLWVCYSQGRFGFSIQGKLLRSCNGRWEQLWARLGWKLSGIWTRYPSAFTWSLQAPDGHMPLINQLRGVRLMDALLNHPALQQRINAAGPGVMGR